MANFKEQDIVEGCIEKLSENFGTDFKLLSYKSVSGGCINHTLKISTSAGDFFLKWNDSGPEDLFMREAEGLNEMRLAESSEIIIPKVIWNKSSDVQPGLLLLEYLQAPGSVKGFDERLGRGLARLHRKTATQFGFHHSNYCGTTLQENKWNSNWPVFFANQRIWSLVQKIKPVRGLPSDEMKIYEKLVARIPDLLVHPTIPSLIHGDLWSGNYMHSANGPALIDPACYYADREMELGMMLLFGGFNSTVWNAYLNEFPLPPEWKERVRLYQLYHVLNHFLLFGGSYGREALLIAKEYI
ncbi:MAG: fructosamine kinase family protein [Prolixibacteraceae bacterium]